MTLFIPDTYEPNMCFRLTITFPKVDDDVNGILAFYVLFLVPIYAYHVGIVGNILLGMNDGEMLFFSTNSIQSAVVLPGTIFSVQHLFWWSSQVLYRDHRVEFIGQIPTFILHATFLRVPFYWKHQLLHT